MSRIVDLTHPLDEQTPPFPGDPAVRISVLSQTASVDRQPREHSNVGQIETCLHSGTHMDAPFHFFGNGTTIDQVSLDACCGQCLLINLPQIEPGQSVSAEMLEEHVVAMRKATRVVLNTGWFRYWKQANYFTEHPVIGIDAAELIVKAGVQLIGVDFPSVDYAPHLTHLELLGSDVLIVENLTNLDRIEKEEFEIIALPLAITGRDGSPIRAIARIDD